MSLSVEHVLVKIVQWRKSSEFKRAEDVLEEVENFCYLGDTISCCGESEAASARIGSVWKKFRELSGVLVGCVG